MISVIICSRNKKIDENFHENIINTIGAVPFELIFIDNSEKKYSIFQAYNYGASHSKFELLCFMHDDIRFHSIGWGLSVKEHLLSENVGFIGLAGGFYLSRTPSPWWLSNYTKLDSYYESNLIQHYKGSHIHTVNETKKGVQKAIVLDGVWLCTKRQVWESIMFDEKYFKSFHFYDLDISLAAYLSGLNNYIVRDIKVEHFSAGHMDEGWIDSAILFKKKWQSKLPLSIKDITYYERIKLEGAILYNLLIVMKGNDYPRKEIWFQYWFKYWVLNFWNKKPYSLLVYYFK
ncbi:glycosyltransferase [Flavihumibacter sediminis]|nr:glycosyltransferase [Flavihumibacter sediminis]